MLSDDSHACALRVSFSGLVTERVGFNTKDAKGCSSRCRVDQRAIRIPARKPGSLSCHLSGSRRRCRLVSYAQARPRGLDGYDSHGAAVDLCGVGPKPPGLSSASPRQSDFQRQLSPRIPPAPCEDSQHPKCATIPGMRASPRERSSPAMSLPLLRCAAVRPPHLSPPRGCQSDAFARSASQRVARRNDSGVMAHRRLNSDSTKATSPSR
jgi:hypothetical protein